MLRGIVQAKTRQVLKRTALSLGVDVMTLKGRQEFEGRWNSEYLELLAKSRGAELPHNAERLRLLLNLNGTRPAEAAHLIVCLAETRMLPGDVCECGVGSGATSALLAAELRGTGKCLWLFDTFTGLPKPTPEDRLVDDILRLGSMAAYEGRMKHAQAEVQNRLKAIGIPDDAYRIVPGLFEKSVAAAVLPERVSFAYIDFDFYAPIKLALDVLSARLSPGGVIIVDDYGYFSAGAQSAVDEFIAARPREFSIEVPEYCHEHFAIIRSTGVPAQV